jgi:TonB family protein
MKAKGRKMRWDLKSIVAVLSTVMLLSTFSGAQPSAVSNCNPKSGQIDLHRLVFISGAIPTYPALARAAKITGTTALRVYLRNGVVTCVIVNSSSSAMLDIAAKQALESWKFESVDGYFDTMFVFEIKGGETTLPENPYLEIRIPESVRLSAKQTKATCHDCSPE